MHWGGKQVYTPFQSDSLREETTWKTWCVWEDNFKMQLKEKGCALHFIFIY
jgi:hypothetical protein